MTEPAASATTLSAPSDLPSVDRLLQSAALRSLSESHGHTCVADAARTVLDACRSRILSGEVLDPATLPHLVTERVEKQLALSLTPVINLTGTVIHTNLGRSPLPDVAIDAMARAARQPVNLEYDLGPGKRGDRDSHLENRLCALTGAEAATVVNNNAAAVLLVLNTLANRRAVPVSRGELVEIGGSFRLPDVMRRAGAKLVEVGATNRTHLKDFDAAMDDNPALVLKAHTSNYAVVGFTASVPEKELAALCKTHDVPFCIDLGSGTVVDLTRFGLPHEPTVQEALAHGADLVTFSGDKLLGGPQSGVIAGRADLIQRIKKNPMRRALRLDKVTIAALDATLTLYQQPERLAETVPSLRALARPISKIAETANILHAAFSNTRPKSWKVDIADCFSQIGSGALPAESLPSKAVRFRPEGAGKKAGRQLTELAAEFRHLRIPVIGRIGDGAFWLDVRCLENPEELTGQLSQITWPAAP